MAIPENLLVGIACIIGKGNSPESERLTAQLTQEQIQIAEQLQQNGVCEQLEQYLQKQPSSPIGDFLQTACQSCLQTTTITANKDEK